MLDAYIYDGLRTAFGRHGGVLAPLRPDDMLASVIRTLVERNPFAAADYEDVIAGCTNQAGEDARNVARHAGLLAGLPVSWPGKPSTACAAADCRRPWMPHARSRSTRARW